VVVLDGFCKHYFWSGQSIHSGKGAVWRGSKGYGADWKERCLVEKGRERPGIRDGQANPLSSQCVQYLIYGWFVE